MFVSWVSKVSSSLLLRYALVSIVVELAAASTGCVHASSIQHATQAAAMLSLLPVLMMAKEEAKTKEGGRNGGEGS